MGVRVYFFGNDRITLNEALPTTKTAWIHTEVGKETVYRDNSRRGVFYADLGKDLLMARMPYWLEDFEVIEITAVETTSTPLKRGIYSWECVVEAEVTTTGPLPAGGGVQMSLVRLKGMDLEDVVGAFRLLLAGEAAPEKEYKGNAL